MLASVPLLGLLPASAILDAAGDESLEAVAAGELRPAYVPARPPGRSRAAAGRSSRPSGFARARTRPARRVDGDTVTLDGDGRVRARRSRAPVCWSRSAVDGDGEPVAAAVDADADGVSVEPVIRYDATRSLGHVTFSGARGRRLDVGAEVLADAWYLAQALIAAESIGAVQTCLDVSVAYAKERFTFGRAIGSYQAIKHELTEVLRRLENSRGLQYYAGWARGVGPRGVPARRQRRPLGGRRRAGLRRPRDDQRPRRDRRHLGARRAAVLPPGAAVRGGCLAGTHDATDRVAEQTMAGAAAA